MLKSASEVLEMTVSPQQTESNKETLPFSELAAQRWSVVTFNDCPASGLTYEEASRLVQQLSDDVPGLCIVTDEAAKKMFNSNGKKTQEINENSEDLSQKAFQETL